MKLIEQNPFRMLGIPVNATARDLSGNLGKKRLLEIGKEVAFPLDLPSLCASIDRTAASMDTASTAINLPQDKIRHALFWFAKPNDPMGSMAFDNLVQGNIDTAKANFGRGKTWESKLCLATLCLQQDDVVGALFAMNEILNELYCPDFVKTVAGQTYTEEAMALREQYVSGLAEEYDIADLYQNHSGEIPEAFLEVIRKTAVDGPVSAIEKAVAEAKSLDSNNASDYLRAYKKLKTDTAQPLRLLKELLGPSDLRFGRLADKLANQLLQCSVQYHNIIDDSEDQRVTATVIDQCLEMASYANQICVGSLTKERCKKAIETLTEKKENLPPAGVEEETEAILNALRTFASQPDKIAFSKILLNATKPHLQSMKTKLGSNNAFYLKLSTQVVGNALHNLIEEVNEATASGRDAAKPVVNDAWNTMQIMDGFDMEYDFKSEKYQRNRNTLSNMHKELNKKNYGCIVSLIVFIVLGLIIGAIIDSNRGDFAVGFIWSGIISSIVYKIMGD